MNILVTGGSSGLGKTIVEKLAPNPDNIVYFTYNRHVDTAEFMVSSYSNVHSIQCDFLDEVSIQELLYSLERWDLDVLIHNAYAGKAEGTHFHKQNVMEFRKSFEMNVLPVIAITQKTLETFRKKKSGKIITVLTASLLNQPPAGYSLYASNKAYLRQLSKSWSKEYIKYGITSNCVSPDFMETEFTSDTDERVVEQMRLEHPLKRLLTTGEVAECILFLVNTSSQINGVNIPVNAGKNIF